MLHPELDRAYCYPALRYFRVRAVDAQGNPCPDCDLPVGAAHLSIFF